MSNPLRFDGRVVVITGAGNGLGRSHALLFGSRGAKVVVNDLGGSAHGEGKSSAAADKVVAEIKAAGGEAVANYDSVEDGGKIIQCALDTFGRIDVVINNAGILRDTSFQKMSEQDWDLIYRVHVLGAFRVTHAAWPHMREQGYGRIILTASAAGIYGNFGQVNYAMAKLGLVGFANSLAIEGKKKNVLVNAIAPIAGSRMTETVMPKELVDALRPEYVSPLVAYLCHESSEENGGLFEVGGGFVSKLRWERTAGHSFRLGRAITPEAVADAWSKITSWDDATHPTDIMASLAPINENINAGPSKGGNELIDVDRALGYRFPDVKSNYDERDLALYALAVGAAQNPLDETDLQSVYELHGAGFRPLPTYAVVPALTAMMKVGQAPGMNFGFERILHGEQYLELKRPLPAKATLTHRSRIKDIFDKGKNALVLTETRSYDESGNEVAFNEFTTLVRGAGGWGGDRGPSAEVNVPPDRKPDAVIEQKIGDNQALIYRLTGDWNPLHADPSFAKNMGFKQPILHGLCTFGYAARHVIRAFAKDGDPRFFKSIKARFADSVFPGETIVTEMWKESDGRIVFRCKARERDAVVISNAAIELFKELPREQPAPAPAASAAAKSGGASAPNDGPPSSEEVFAIIGNHVAQHPELVGKIAAVFQFKLSSPDSVWTLNLKDGAGSVTPGGDKADCTLALTDADFRAMTSGKADPMKLFQEQKLKISGNIMLSQKLSFLQKIDQKAATEFLMKRRGASGGSAAPSTGAPPADGPPTSAEVFGVIRDYIAKHGELVGKIAAVFQFKLSNPDSAWTIDLKNGAGGVTPGGDKADCTLALSDADFLAMTSGKADPMKLFQEQKLKISGNIMLSQKLGFLSKIDPKEAAASLAAQRAGGGAVVVPPNATAGSGATPVTSGSAPANGGASKTPDVFQALGERLAKNPALAAEASALLQFKIKNPEAQWVVDTRAGSVGVRRGTDAAATTTLELDEEHLLALVSGAASPRELFQRGNLRVDGDVRPAHKLGFMRA